MSAPENRTEEEQERLNRQLSELLQELRVAMPGVQILFAFLLAVPFNQRFAETTEFQRDVYLIVLLCAAVAAAFFIAPTAYHRIMFQQGDKKRLIQLATTMAVVGLAALALAMSGAILLVTDFLFDRTTAWILFAATLGLFAGLWFVLGAARRTYKELAQ
jgi:membrane-bound acyltransferase YfiQ involved in biofilm formation